MDTYLKDLQLEPGATKGLLRGLKNAVLGGSGFPLGPIRMRYLKNDIPRRDSDRVTVPWTAFRSSGL